MMIYKEFCEKLSLAQGKQAASLMKEIGNIISNNKPKENKELSELCFKFIPKAILPRKASFAYIITLCQNKKLIEKLSNNDEPRIRESVAKALCQKLDEDMLDFIDDWLALEDLYRVKKWLLLALKNNNSKRATCLLSNYEPEPELFIEHQKLLETTKKPKNISINTISDIVIHTVAGFENLWLKAHGFNGVIISPGFIKLNKQYSLADFIDFRDLFGVGFFLGCEDDFSRTSEVIQNHSLKILFTNEFEKEKTILNKAASVLSDNNLFFHPDSEFALRLMGKDIFIAYYQLKNKHYEFHLPASISSVVASCISLLVPEKVSKVLDPCCGAGTLLIEHQKRHSFSEAYGIDTVKDAIHKAKANAKANHCHISLKQGDARRIPFTNNSFDRVVCNPPFNKRVKIGDKNIFYLKLVKEIKKVLQIGGVAIIYTVQKQTLKEFALQENFIIEQEIKLHLDKVQPSIFVLRKVN